MDKYHFFWGGIFSNWYKASFEVREEDVMMTFNCVEQYMMYKKAKLFMDTESIYKIMATSDPREHKKFGRKVKNFDPLEWDKIKYGVVYIGVFSKFSQNDGLRQKLYTIDCNRFVEASPFDRVWGIGYDEDNALHPNNITNWGENLLGNIITEVRVALYKIESSRD